MGKIKQVYEATQTFKGEDIEFMKFCERENAREHEKQMFELFDKLEEEEQKNGKILLSGKS
jgi:hypothetical protein